MSELRGIHDDRMLTSPVPLDERALAFGITVPLLVAPLEPYRKSCSRRVDGHHGAGFPGDHPGLQPDTVNGMGADSRVIRWSRMQEMLRVLHDRAHSHFDHTPLPQNEHDGFQAALLHVARYIPPTSIDVRGSKWEEVRTTQEQIGQLHLPGVIHPQEHTHWKIGHFFGRHIIEHGLFAVRNTHEASRFLEADSRRRTKFGHDLLRLAAEVVVDPIEPFYQSARRDGLISPTMPDRALRFVMLHFDQRQPDYFESLQGELEAA
jgi:hypothetical protein